MNIIIIPKPASPADDANITGPPRGRNANGTIIRITSITIKPPFIPILSRERTLAKSDVTGLSAVFIAASLSTCERICSPLVFISESMR